MKCPVCRREISVNYDGAIRKHWCQPVTGDSRAITLSSGGTLTVRLDANWMTLGDRERVLINTIIDILHEYEQRSESLPSADAVDPVEGSGQERPRATDLLPVLESQ